jgi:hypothetical protein
MSIRRPSEADWCERIELEELSTDLKGVINKLRIGDRVRVLCDDGVILAEKISEAQFKLIHSLVMSKFIH